MRDIRSQYGFSEKEFEIFFKKNYKLSLLISVRITNDLTTSEDIVQDVFWDLWKKSTVDIFDARLKSYLLKSVRNRSLNFIRDKKEQLEFDPNTYDIFDDEYNFDREEKISKILFEIDKLPPRCKEIFDLVVFKQLKYSDVANELGVTVNTVKTQLNIAYKQLRKFCLIFFDFLHPFPR